MRVSFSCESLSARRPRGARPQKSAVALDGLDAASHGVAHAKTFLDGRDEAVRDEGARHEAPRAARERDERAVRLDRGHGADPNGVARRAGRREDAGARRFEQERRRADLGGRAAARGLGDEAREGLSAGSQTPERPLREGAVVAGERDW